MQKFSIEVNVPIEIALKNTYDQWNPESAILEIVPVERGTGFVIFIKEMTDHVSFMREDGEFKNEFVFDKKDFEERMEKLRSK